MQKIVNTALIMTLISVVIITVSFLWGQDKKKMVDSTVNDITVKNDLQTHGIEVIASTDANFNTKLAQYIGNYNEVIPLADVAKPFAVFIKNNSQKEIVGISLRWQFVKSNGEINEANQIETSPGVLMGMKPRDPFMIGKTSLINDNSLKFFSYFQSIGTELLNAFKSNRSKRFKYKLNPEQAQNYISDVESQKQMLLKDVSNVSVVIDAVVFNDGTFVGENQSFLFEIMSGLIQARRDFLKKLREAEQSGKSNTDNLNKFISEMKSITAERRPTLKYLNGEDTFNQTYRYQMSGFIDEISSKRSRATDIYIVKDFLAVKDSDFIELKRK